MYWNIWFDVFDDVSFLELVLKVCQSLYLSDARHTTNGTIEESRGPNSPSQEFDLIRYMIFEVYVTYTYTIIFVCSQTSISWPRLNVYCHHWCTSTRWLIVSVFALTFQAFDPSNLSKPSKWHVKLYPIPGILLCFLQFLPLPFEIRLNPSCPQKHTIGNKLIMSQGQPAASPS